MDFTKEIDEFPSEVHSVIYHGAREMTTLDRSLADIKDEELKFSCKEYYAYVMELFSDMYAHPEEYGMPVLELEKFLNGKKLNGMKQKFPSKTKSLIAKTRNCAERYLQTLCRIAYMGVLKGDKLILSGEDLTAIEKAVNTSTSPISLKKRLEAFTLTGLISKENDKDSSTISIHSTNHPKMFPAMIALAKKTKGTYSGFNFFLFLKTDFRNINKNYHPTAEDYFAPLAVERKKIGLQIHKLALDLGFKIDISTFFKVNYKYKGAQVMLIDTKDNTLDIRITEVYSWDNQTVFTDLLDKQSDEMKHYADRHLWRCTACATTHVGTMIEFLGKHNRVCGGGQIGFVWRNPVTSDDEKIKYFLNTRCQIIEALKNAEKK